MLLAEVIYNSILHFRQRLYRMCNPGKNHNAKVLTITERKRKREYNREKKRESRACRHYQKIRRYKEYDKQYRTDRKQKDKLEKKKQEERNRRKLWYKKFVQRFLSTTASLNTRAKLALNCIGKYRHVSETSRFLGLRWHYVRSLGNLDEKPKT